MQREDLLIAAQDWAEDMRNSGDLSKRENALPRFLACMSDLMDEFTDWNARAKQTPSPAHRMPAR